jgi:hypothetical protein
MEKERIIKYLLIKGFSEQQILRIMQSNAMRNLIEKDILEYDTKLSYNDFSKREVTETFDTYKILQAKRKKEKLLQKKRIGK